MEKEYLALESDFDYDDVMSFNYMYFLSGVDINLLLEETIKDVIRQEILISKIEHNEYIQIRRKRKFKKKIKK